VDPLGARTLRQSLRRGAAGSSLALVAALSLGAGPAAGVELVQQGPKLTASGETGEGVFGYSVAISSDGNTAVIGAPNDSAGAGAAWVFTRSGETWTQGEKLTGSGESGSAHFGRSVAISSAGDTVIVGGPRDNAGTGAAWVFTRSGETWTPQGGKLTGSGEIGEGEFGYSVAISGDVRAAVGGRGDNGGVGAVWMFVHGTEWAQQGEKLTGGGEVGSGRFGASVAMTEGKAVVGGPGDNGEFGAVWPFTRTGSGWVAQGAKLTGSEETNASRLGASVALDEKADTAIAGGPQAGYGAAWIFTRSSETWTSGGKKIHAHYALEHSEFGASVSISGNGGTALVGGPAEGGPTGVELYDGAAWIFSSSGGWHQEGGVIEGEPGDELAEFGSAVALSADRGTALIGAPYEAASIGSVFAYAVRESKLEAPEVGRCKKVPEGTGSYKNSSCTAPLGGGKHEWFPELLKPGFTTKLTTGNVKLETVGLAKVTCLGESGSGEFVARKEAGRIKLILTGCELSGTKCAGAGAGEGEISTSLLAGRLGVVELGETPAKNKEGLLLFPAKAGEPVASFACGPTQVLIRGAFIVPLPYSKMGRLMGVKVIALKGKQKPEHFLGGPPEVLEASFDEGPFELIGLSAALTFEFEEAAEINSVV
jgi:hypothetical protein